LFSDYIETSEPEGASGFTPEVEEYIPKWDDPRTEEYTDEMVEVRRRRLEKFLSDTKTSENNLTDTDKKSEQ
jgi:hypothetical protein